MFYLCFLFILTWVSGLISQFPRFIVMSIMISCLIKLFTSSRCITFLSFSLVLGSMFICDCSCSLANYFLVLFTLHFLLDLLPDIFCLLAGSVIALPGHESLDRKPLFTELFRKFSFVLRLIGTCIKVMFLDIFLWLVFDVECFVFTLCFH